MLFELGIAKGKSNVVCITECRSGVPENITAADSDRQVVQNLHHTSSPGKRCKF